MIAARKNKKINNPRQSNPQQRFEPAANENPARITLPHSSESIPDKETAKIPHHENLENNIENRNQRKHIKSSFLAEHAAGSLSST